MNHLKKFNESSDENESQINSSLSYIENKIIEILNEADEKLNKEEFEQLSESISDYIDEIARSKHDSITFFVSSNRNIS
jgi:uncharacterized membrane-anchored protein YjiN (DUF445 family)